jgi:hypothetical protein
VSHNSSANDSDELDRILAPQMPMGGARTETESMGVGTPKVSAFDLVPHPYGSAYLRITAIVVAELVERIDAIALVARFQHHRRRSRFPSALAFLLDSCRMSPTL